MTLHSAKGLEFDTVFLPGWEEGLFPSQRTLDESGRAGLEEERRLAYVGITRARKRAYIRFASNRRMHGLWQASIPSRFLDELPEAHVDVVEETLDLWRLRLNAYGASRFDLRDPFDNTLRHARLAARPEEPRGERRRGDGRLRQLLRTEIRSQRLIEGELVAKSVIGDGFRILARASASSTRNSAMAASPRSTATSSPSTSRRPDRSACSTASSDGPDALSSSPRASRVPAPSSSVTFTATVTLDEANALRLSAALEADAALSSLPLDLHERSAGCWQLIIYLAETPRPLVRALESLARPALGRTVTFDIEELPNDDWVARSLAGLKPIRAGRFLVHGRHDRNRLRPNDIGIEIEAGQAFGTGHHGTTIGCLRAIDRLARARPVHSALDLGTGTGVLGIAIAKATKARILASDIDPVAVDVARANVRLNGASRFMRVIVAAGLDLATFRAHAPFDLIVANILAGPLVKLAPAVRRLLAPSGTVILSGLLPEQRARIIAAYRGQGLRVVDSLIVEDWLTLTFRRP